MLNTSDDFEASVDTSGKLERERLDRLSNIKIVSGSELMQTKFEAPRYFWEGILPDAGLCVMAASKASGKTMFLLQAADAISKGRDFLGIPTRLTKTLFVELELTKRKMQERLFKMGIVLDDNLGFAFNGKQGDVWLQTIQDAVVEYGYKLVVVDVLQRLWPEKADTNSYQDTYALLGPLRAIANELQCLIVLVTHCRKADVVDYIDGVIGSVGIVANADVILTLKRERGASEAALFIDGNDIEHKELALNFNTDPLGFSLSNASPAEIGLTSERRDVLGAIRSLRGSARPAQIAELLGKDEKAVSKLCIKLVTDGLLKNTKYGTFALFDPEKVGEVGEPGEVDRNASPTSTTSPGIFGGDEAKLCVS